MPLPHLYESWTKQSGHGQRPEHGQECGELQDGAHRLLSFEAVEDRGKRGFLVADVRWLKLTGAARKVVNVCAIARAAAISSGAARFDRQSERDGRTRSGKREQSSTETQQRVPPHAGGEIGGTFVPA
jgi:hypothetical protein